MYPSIGPQDEVDALTKEAFLGLTYLRLLWKEEVEA